MVQNRRRCFYIHLRTSGTTGATTLLPVLHLIRLLLLSVHFVVAGCINLCIVLCRPFNPDNSRVCGRVYSIPACWILGLPLRADVASMVAQPRPCVIVANHQSNYDLFIFGSVLPKRTVSVGKTSLKWVPFFGQVYWLAGNVLIDRGNAIKAKNAMLKTTDTMQHHDTSIWMFAEGTRNFGEELLPFKRGAFQMAIAAGVPIVPLCCSSYRKTMRLNRWRSGNLVMRSLPAIATAGLTVDDIPALMAQCRSAMLACIEELDRAALQAA